jgi:DNA (cytosine-5)-methyltransferase 1
MRAIDLYSGVGGWSLGLALSGIEVVASYERFEPANITNRQNNGHSAFKADIRTFDLSELPQNIDLVVGSPPCTQFSYSNRGGAGDLKDGLKDISRFLKIVDYVRPRFWVMENVPRVADVLEKELRKGGALEDFLHLDTQVRIYNMESFGLPQRRRRCLAGNIDFDLLESYAPLTGSRTLGDIVGAYRKSPILDPIYGVVIEDDRLTDHVIEPALDAEEERVNRSAKVTHPVYNAMPFPDPLDRSVRTITATCTRVSRESVVIAHPDKPGSFRRLTLRERASLQGFPASFQFYGSSHGQRATMIGNAVPPLFSFYVGQACLETLPDQLASPDQAIERFEAPSSLAPSVKSEAAGKRYPQGRTFRFSIPNLHFKSGVRFDLSNRKDGQSPRWHVAFYFGPSTSIQQLHLTAELEQALFAALPPEAKEKLVPLLGSLRTYVANADVKRMQDVWTRTHPGLTRPFDFLDHLGEAGAAMAKALDCIDDEHANIALAHVLFRQYGQASQALPGIPKLQRNARFILAGILVGATVNEEIEPSAQPLPQDQRKVAGR